MEQIGFVKKTLGDKVEIEVSRISGCGGGCKTCSGCDTPGHSLIIKNNLNVKVGDIVKVKGEVKNIMKYTFIVYFIPLSMLLLGVFSGIKMFSGSNSINPEVAGFILGLIFMGLGYLLVKLIDSKIGKKDETAISIIEVL